MLHYFKLLGPLFGTRDATNAKVLDFALVEVFNRGVVTGTNILFQCFTLLLEDKLI